MSVPQVQDQETTSACATSPADTDIVLQDHVPALDTEHE